MTSVPLVKPVLRALSIMRRGIFASVIGSRSEYVAPSVVDDHVAHFLAIVSQQPKPVYVHCRYGENRTGVMVAAYRMVVEGVSEEAAIEEMRRYQGLWFNADAKYIRGLSPERRERIRRKVMEWIPKLKMDAQVVCTNGTCAVSDR